MAWIRAQQICSSAVDARILEVVPKSIAIFGVPFCA